MRAKALKAVLATSLTVAASSALATDIRFDGFASFVGGQIINSKELPTDGNGTTIPWRGFTKDFSFQNNSLFGLQATADVKDNLSATVQVEAKGVNDFKANFNWAYLNYNINEEWSVKVGRQRVPYFMYSDFLDVGYAYPWIAPPYYAYDLGGFDSGDGVSVSYVKDIGDWTSRLTMMYNSNHTSVTTQGTTYDVLINHQTLIAWSMNYNWLTLRGVYALSKDTVDISAQVKAIYDGFQQAGFPLSPKVRKDFLVDGDKGTFAGVGFNIDPGTFFLTSEYTQTSISDSILYDPSRRWYASAGYHFGKFTPFVVYEHVNASYNKKALARVVNTSFPSSTYPDAFRAIVTDQLRPVFDNVNVQKAKSYTVGLRYDFHPSACAKLEFMRENNDKTNTTPEAIAIAVQMVY